MANTARSIRISDDLWDAISDEARREGIENSQWIREASIAMLWIKRLMRFRSVGNVAILAAALFRRNVDVVHDLAEDEFKRLEKAISDESSQ